MHAAAQLTSETHPSPISSRVSELRMDPSSAWTRSSRTCEVILSPYTVSYANANVVQPLPAPERTTYRTRRGNYNAAVPHTITLRSVQYSRQTTNNIIINLIPAQQQHPSAPSESGHMGRRTRVDGLSRQLRERHERQ